MTVILKRYLSPFPSAICTEMVCVTQGLAPTPQHTHPVSGTVKSNIIMKLNTQRN